MIKRLFVLGGVGILLGSCSHQSSTPFDRQESSAFQAPTGSFERVTVEGLPLLQKLSSGQEIFLSAFSGLWYETTNEKGEWLFTAITDRGPNAEPFSEKDRPFVLPKFSPSLISVALDTQKGTARFVQRIPLRLPDGRGVSGLPNKKEDELPVTTRGKKLRLDPNGLDTEGVVRAADGTYWLCDEYGPSIIHFTADGRWLERFVPKGTKVKGMVKTKDILPASYALRRLNRGFEAIAISGQKIYVFLQSPLKKNSLTIRVLEFDTKTKQVSAEYLYVMGSPKADRIGDAVALTSGQVLVIERDGQVGRESKKKIYRVDFSHATNLLNVPEDVRERADEMDMPALASAHITPARISLALDLAASGFDYAEKAEGLARVGDTRLVVANDNDFGLAGKIDVRTGKIPLKSEGTSLLLIDMPKPKN